MEGLEYHCVLWISAYTKTHTIHSFIHSLVDADGVLYYNQSIANRSSAICIGYAATGSSARGLLVLLLRDARDNANYLHRVAQNSKPLSLIIIKSY